MSESAKEHPNAKDSLARLLGISALVLSFCLFVAVLVLAPWTLFRLWEVSEKLSEKPNAERFVELQAKINGLEHKIMLLEIVQMETKKEEDSEPVVFPRVETTTKESPSLDVFAKNKRSIREDKNVSGANGGTVYTIWGRSECPSTYTTSSLYTGIIGVSHSAHTGGGSNHQCLPLDPEFGYKQAGQQYTAAVGGSILVGVEYRATNIFPFDNSNNAGNSLNGEDAVCSVCFVQERSVSIMIPARQTCPEGWTLEYLGYLMSSHYKNFRVDYICVDKAPDAKQSGETTVGASYLYPVEGICGALPCPEYTDGLELACVVCTH